MPGRVVRLTPADPALPVPNIGWCDVGDADAYYFAHGYHLVPDDPADRAGDVRLRRARWRRSCAAASVTGVQFHPEKSQDAGLEMLERFAPVGGARVSAVRPRLVPVLLLKHGLLVRSQWFRIHQVIGNPVAHRRAATRTGTSTSWSCSTSQRATTATTCAATTCELRIRGLHRPRRAARGRARLRSCRSPSAGASARWRTSRLRLAAGADKCVINTAALDDPDARRRGRAALRLAVRRGQHRREAHDRRHATRCCVDGGRRRPACDAAEWAARGRARGAPARSSSTRSTATAPARATTSTSSARSPSAVTIPVVACGGVGRYEHFAPGVIDGGRRARRPPPTSSTSSSSATRNAKQACLDAGVADAPGRARQPLAARASRATTPPSATGALAARPQRAADAAPAPTPRASADADPLVHALRLPVDQRRARMEFDEHGRLQRLPRWPTREGRRSRRPSGRAAASCCASCSSAYRCRDGSRHDCVIPVQRRQGQLLPDPRHQARVRPQPAARHLQRQQLDRRRAGATCTRMRRSSTSITSSCSPVGGAR